ncbi:hypothetical protein, partial [Mycobacterium marinum]
IPQLTSRLINNAGALTPYRPGVLSLDPPTDLGDWCLYLLIPIIGVGPEGVAGLSSLSCALRSGLSAGSGCCARLGLYLMVLCRNAS